MGNRSYWISITLLAAFLTLVLSWPVWAVEAQIGRGLVCDEARQVTEYLKRGEYETINAKEKDACAILLVAFMRGKAVGEITTPKGSVVVTEILILAYNDGRVWRNVTPMIQYTMFVLPGEGA
jgi:hypothetical protein